MRKTTLSLIALFLSLPSGSHAATLGSFTFNDQLFGASLVESDGGALRNSAWLNVVNANPGNPGALTGANFDTGIANVSPTVLYTITYGIPIVNGEGADLGIVAARFSANNFTVSISSDGSVFSPSQTYLAGSAVDTGVTKNYYFAGGGPFTAGLFVYAIDLSQFGIAPNASISSLQISSDLEGDLIRVAGFGSAQSPPDQSPLQPPGTDQPLPDQPGELPAESVPEPATAALLGFGLLLLMGGKLLVKTRRC